MFRRILSAEERTAIRKYLAKDGEKEHKIRNIVYESRKHLPTIEADLALLRKLLAAYRKTIQL
jgi:ribosomal protein S24E